MKTDETSSRTARGRVRAPDRGRFREPVGEGEWSREDLETEPNGRTSAAALSCRIVSHPFFRGMQAEHRGLIAQFAEEATYETDELLFRQGGPASQFHLIESGRIAVEAHDPASGTETVQVLEPGDVLGWSWLFPPFVWHFQARALEPASVIVLDGANLLLAAEDDHEFGHELMKRVSRIVIQRLQAARNALLERRLEATRHG